MSLSRRDLFKRAGIVGTTIGAGFRGIRPVSAAVELGAEPRAIRVAGRDVSIAIEPVGRSTTRISIVPVENGSAGEVANFGALVESDRRGPVARVSRLGDPVTIASGDSRVYISANPLTIRVDDATGRTVQRLTIDSESAAVDFDLGDGPILGLGEGGAQFDRRGSIDRMRSGQGGYRLRTHGGRVPIPWLIGTKGWGMFIHQPLGTFDLSRDSGRFSPQDAASALPIDVFVVASADPTRILEEYATITGFPELPPLWSLGYQQSHRTLADRDEILGIARTFREKKLPCDALIYLGTGFCPSGWNTGHGSFTFNKSIFPDPNAMIDRLHALHFHVVPHIVIRSKTLRGTVADRFDAAHPRDEEVASYWNGHRPALAAGFDGWWPDEGDPLDVASRLARIRMYWEGSRLDRPDVRPFALHRNGAPGMARYAPFLWSGDVHSTWETLKTHVPIAINTSLSGIPYWGTDTGGFIPTKELTGELYVRWFQFSAFCPSFRSHGRTWKLRLPWGWNTGELGPDEIRPNGDAANPDPSELRNAEVEPICRKFLELRYRMLPYLYSIVNECCKTGIPIIRALWLRYPDDSVAVARGDEFLWGPSVLVAPVTEKGAVSRRVYLPRGGWYDFWTDERFEGGREIDVKVDLTIIPIYISSGSIVPFGPVKQYVDEPIDEPLTLVIYPGADGEFLLYEDDGKTFGYQTGDWTGIRMCWNDAGRELSLALSEGSRLRPPHNRVIRARVVPSTETREVVFAGKPVSVVW